MAILVTILFAALFFGSVFFFGSSGNVYYFVSVQFMWILIGGVLVRLRNQLNDPIDNVYLKKEILVQLAIVVSVAIIILMLKYFSIISDDIFNILSILTLISCGFIVVDSITFVRNKLSR